MKTKFRLISLMLALAMLLSMGGFFSYAAKGTETNATAATSDESYPDYGLAKQIKGSQILHCWCWSFETITNELPNIAAAGFTAIQTSPINECKIGEDGGMQLMGDGKWYYHYQPTDYKIGNYQLGTLEEFELMCETAEKYGIKVIVDAVVNHVSSDMSVVSDNVTSIDGGAFHNRGGLSNFDDRECVTQENLLGLHDLNTQNPNVQQYIKDYLVSCVEAGASGFRYDAAKHIELPVDDEEYASDFWPVILENGAEFQYGETLQGGATKFAEYSKYMNNTAAWYGDKLRESLRNESLSAEELTDYRSEGVSAEKLVTIVETHDNYTGENSWSTLTSKDIILGWAILVARENTTPLYFARPDGSSTSNQWGKNQIGIAGDGTYYSKEVTALNRFRNEMQGENEKLSNIGGSDSVLMIERGTKGAVIVNASDKAIDISAPSVLDDGEYTEQITGNTFTVKDGVLKGEVGANTVAVVYNSQVNYPVKIDFSYTGEMIHNGIELSVSVNSADKAYYTVNNGEPVAFSDTAAVDIRSFKDGETFTVTVYGENEIGSLSKSYTYRKFDTPVYNAETSVYFNNSAGEFKEVFVFTYRIVDGKMEAEYGWPGVHALELADNFYGYVLPDWEETYVIFSDAGKNQTSDPGYIVKKGETKLYSEGEWSDYGGEGEVISNPYKSFDGEEYIYFDPSACKWFYNDGGEPIIKLTYGEYNSMEKFYTAEDKLLWRYKPTAGKYATMAISRDTGLGIYNEFITNFSDDNNLYVAYSDWNNGGSWTVFEEQATPSQPTSTAPNIPDKELLLGDVDLNGEVNVKDATLIQKHVAEILALNEEQASVADVNKDQTVNVKDATLIQKFAADIVESFGVISIV